MRQRDGRPGDVLNRRPRDRRDPCVRLGVDDGDSHPGRRGAAARKRNRGGPVRCRGERRSRGGRDCGVADRAELARLHGGYAVERFPIGVSEKHLSVQAGLRPRLSVPQRAEGRVPGRGSADRRRDSVDSNELRRRSDEPRQKSRLVGELRNREDRHAGDRVARSDLLADPSLEHVHPLQPVEWKAGRRAPRERAAARLRGGWHERKPSGGQE